MFYDVLMEKSAKALEDDEKKQLAALGAVGASGLAIKGSKNLQKASLAALRRNLVDDEKGLAALVNRMGKSVDTVAGPYGAVVTKDGRPIDVNLRSASRGAQHNPIPRFYDPGKRGALNFGKGYRDHDVFFHELGHATGAGAKSKIQKRLSGFKVGLGVDATKRKLRALNQLGGGISAAYAASASNKDEADKANRAANAALFSSGLMTIPTLAEEARASLRARGLAKKFSRGLRGGVLLPAYGSYVGSALATASPALIAKGIAKYKQRKYRDEKNASHEQDYDAGDALTTGGRAFAGYLTGRGLAGASVLGRSKELPDFDKLHRKARTVGLLGAGAGLAYDHYKRKKRRALKKD